MLLCTTSLLLSLVIILIPPTCIAVYNGVPMSENDILDKSEYPYAAILEDKEEAVCGSAIIREDAVITVAHCVRDAQPSNLRIRAGTYWKGDSTPGKVQVINVANILSHENFNETILNENDIAILLLEKNFEFTPFVNKIDIATEMVRDSTYGKDVIFLGWGNTEEGVPSRVLRQARLQLINRKKCIKKRPKVSKMSDSMICAISKDWDQGGCAGDSGGPLIKRALKSGEIDILIGVTSFGFPSSIEDGTCLPVFPFTFTDLAALTPWINEKLGIPIPTQKPKKKWFCGLK